MDMVHTSQKFALHLTMPSILKTRSVKLSEFAHIMYNVLDLDRTDNIQVILHGQDMKSIE